MGEERTSSCTDQELCIRNQVDGWGLSDPSAVSERTLKSLCRSGLGRSLSLRSSIRADQRSRDRGNRGAQQPIEGREL